MISSKLFSYDKKHKSFAAEASDLPVNVLDGFKIMSVKTGVSMQFNLSHTEIDEDHDVRWWEFTSRTLGLKCIIFND